MVGAGVLSGEVREQRGGECEEDEQGQDGGGREGGGPPSDPPPHLASGAGARGDGPGCRRGPFEGDAHLTATCEMSRTPVQSLMTTFLTSLPTSRL